MKHAIFTVCIVLVSGILALGTAAPDFSGNWIRDAAKSDSMATYVDGKVTPINVNLVVRQQANNLQVESIWGNKPSTQISYVLDGNEHTFTDERGGSLTYQATMKGDQLVIEGYKKASTPFGTAEIKTKEEWLLSADGRTLTITTTTATSSFREQTRKQIYTK